MVQRFNAVYTKHGKWYLGWVEEIPGVNTQGKTLVEAKENLRDALILVLEVNRQLARQAAVGRIVREAVTVPA